MLVLYAWPVSKFSKAVTVMNDIVTYLRAGREGGKILNTNEPSGPPNLHKREISESGKFLAFFALPVTGRLFHTAH